MTRPLPLAILLLSVLTLPTFAADTNRQLGDKEFKASNYGKAIEYYTKAIRESITDHHSYFWRAQCFEETGDYARAYEDYAAATVYVPLTKTGTPKPIDPALAAKYENGLAWFLATTPSDKHRNGRLAVRSASRACALTDSKIPAYVDTLAAAHAESGDFARARITQLAAWGQCDKDEKDDYYSRYKLYLQSKPYRQSRSAKETPLTAQERKWIDEHQWNFGDSRSQITFRLFEKDRFTKQNNGRSQVTGDAGSKTRIEIYRGIRSWSEAGGKTRLVFKNLVTYLGRDVPVDGELWFSFDYTDKENIRIKLDKVVGEPLQYEGRIGPAKLGEYLRLYREKE